MPDDPSLGRKAIEAATPDGAVAGQADRNAKHPFNKRRVAELCELGLGQTRIAGDLGVGAGTVNRLVRQVRVRFGVYCLQSVVKKAQSLLDPAGPSFNMRS